MPRPVSRAALVAAVLLAGGPAPGGSGAGGPAEAPGPVPPAPRAVAARADTIRITDDLRRRLAFAAPPRRIVSLIPAATEILFEIGAGGSVTGRSRFDDHPPEVRELPSLGDAIRPSAELVLAHRPQVVVLFAGADNESALREFERLGIPTLALHLNSLADLERTIDTLGRLTGREAAAADLARRIGGQLAAVRDRTRGLPRPTVYYDIWYPPPITVGAGSYLDTLIALAGGRNAFADLAPPSPRVSLEAIVARDPDLILHPVSRDPAARQTLPAARPGWEAIRAVRRGAVRTVDADVVHRLGPRIGTAARLLAEAIHPSPEGRSSPRSAPPAPADRP